LSLVEADHADPKTARFHQGNLSGISCLKSASTFGKSSCEKLQINKGATVRFRAVVEDVHPSYGRYILQVLQACSNSCPGGYLRGR